MGFPLRNYLLIFVGAKAVVMLIVVWDEAGIIWKWTMVSDWLLWCCLWIGSRVIIVVPVGKVGVLPFGWIHGDSWE